MSINELILVTGGSGFVGSYCILYALQKGYRARTTVRSLTRVDDVRKMLVAGGVTVAQAESVEFCAADLAKDDGWTEACKDCTYVLHVASPFPLSVPKNEDDLIVPARDGALRVLKAAKAAGTVKRVVMTSSVAAIVHGSGDSSKEKPFTEKDWTELEHPVIPVQPYPKSKTVAERAAWDWIEKEGGELELAVINPTGIAGPVLSKDYAPSVELVVRLMNGALPGLPALNIGYVDVRDVADLHFRAMTDPKAKGERFIASSGDVMSLYSVAMVLKSRMDTKAKRVPTLRLPSFLLRVMALFDPAVALVVSELDQWKWVSNEKARTVLGWQPRSPEDAIVASAESMEPHGLLKI